MIGRTSAAVLLGTLLPLAACTSTIPGGGRDHVHVTGQIDGDEVGIVVDAEGVDNRRRWTTSGTAPVGNLEASGESNDLICFARERPMILCSDPGWTPHGDDVDVAFDAEIGIPLRICIVAKPYETHELRAIRALCKTVRIWKRERMGITVSEVDFIDATGLAAADPYRDFEIKDHVAIKKTLLDAGLRKDFFDRITVYYVDRVQEEGGTDLLTNAGHASESNDSIAIGKTAGPDLLAHELGHCLALEHPECSSWPDLFDKENVMWASSSVRQYLTEGQIFRAQASHDSALNELYKKRLGETLPLTEWVLPRPLPIWFRMWDDGDFSRDAVPGSP